MNPELPTMLDRALGRGFRVLVLTNAMKPMHKMTRALLGLRDRYGERLTIRVSIDHYGPAVHETERGRRSWAPTIDGLKWLAANGLAVAVASRRLSGESEAALRRGFARLFDQLGVAIDTEDPAALTIFPEMDEAADVPEITEACWGILGTSPARCCLTIRASISGLISPARWAGWRSIIRIAPNSACSAAAPAAADSRTETPSAVATNRSERVDTVPGRHILPLVKTTGSIVKNEQRE